jgi:hypothetical protein
MQAIPRFPTILACVATALAAAACGSSVSSSSSSSTTAATAAGAATTTGSTAPTSSASTTATSSAASSSAAASAGGRCDQLLVQASPRVTRASTPKLASLDAKTLSDEASAFRFDGRTCLATVNPAQVITLTGIARLRPSLVVDGHETLAGRNLEVRFIGSTVYIYLAEIAARDGGKPWLKASLKNLSAASGLNFGQLLGEVRQFSPGHPSPLLKATKAFHSLGTATVSGQRAFVYQGEFTPASLARSGVAGVLGKQSEAKLKQLGATRESATVYLSPAGVALETVTGIYKGSQLLTVSISSSSRTTQAVTVTPPPARKTIDYSKVAG